MKKLNRKKLFFYGLAGLGPNMLNLMVGAYLCDALMVNGFAIKDLGAWTYLSKTLVCVGVWSIIVTVAKIIDGIVDIPLGAMTDNLKTRWGKRRPSILIGVIATVLSYVMFLIVPVAAENSIINTIWFGFWLCAFYASYTLLMVTYYATFSEVTKNDADRMYLSNVKSGADVVYFVLGYAAIPALTGLANIRILAAIVTIFILTMIIPFKVLKERSTLPKDVELYKKAHPEDEINKIEEPGMIKSFEYTVKNKTFWLWMIIYGCLQFGLQMWLTGFNVYYSGTVNFDGMKIMLCNVACFAPVPFTLILYNKIINKKGFKAAFQYALSMFSIGMILFMFCRPSIMHNETLRLVLSLLAGVTCSFGIGSFFSVAYAIPSQIAVMEKEEKGVSHPSMYFAVQGLVEAVVAAISTGLVWINLKKIGPNGFALLEPSGASGLLTLIVACSCIVALICTSFLPKALNKVGQVKKDK